MSLRIESTFMQAAPLPPSPIATDQDANLLIFYTCLATQIDTEDQLHLQGSPSEQARVIRTWINNENLDVLRLDLSHSGLTHLPEEVQSLYSLQELILSHSQLVSLPDPFILHDLRKLDISHTGITSLPKVFDLPNLVEFHASHTPIESLPESWGALDFDWLNLDPHEEKLAELDDEVWNNPYLLDRYGAKPQRLKNLQILDVSHTPLKALPREFNPRKLKRINIEGTQLKELPPYIQIRFNLLETLSEKRPKD